LARKSRWEIDPTRYLLFAGKETDNPLGMFAYRGNYNTFIAAMRGFDWDDYEWGHVATVTPDGIFLPVMQIQKGGNWQKVQRD
jgi:hypothetical protein